MSKLKNATLEDFMRWRVEELKEYIKDRGLSIASKRKAELASLAYAASEMKMPKVPRKEVVQQQVDKDFASLLTVEIGDTKYELPDVLKLEDGWVGEKDGMVRFTKTTL